MTAFELFFCCRVQTFSSHVGRRLHLLVRFLGGVIRFREKSSECEGQHATLRRSQIRFNS